MSETNDAGAAAAKGAAVRSAEASAIAEAVEEALAKETSVAVVAPILTASAAEADAWRVYQGWRNARLGTLSPDAFRQVEQAAPDLVAAIIAAFSTST
jgi:hypothetical protein